MKFAAHSLLLISLAATFAYAQTQTNLYPQVQHVIIVIQENRTPENLFNQDTALQNKAHVQPGSNAGLCNVAGHRTISLTPTPLFTCWDPMHNHAGTYPSWVTTWDNGAMDGACSNDIAHNSNCGKPSCVVSTNNPYYETCSYSYVDNSTGILNPYFQLANQYGFANYMFQTNQGPSFPAHQFLFSGTSAPIQFNDPNDPCLDMPSDHPCWVWFDAENVGGNTNDKTTGCIANAGRTAYQIDPTTAESYPPNPIQVNRVNLPAGFPCYSHPTLATLLDNSQPAPITWKYYAQSPKDLWTAPTAMNTVCDTNGPGGQCQSAEWQDNVRDVLPNQGNYPNDGAPFLTDIANCHLPQVSWVIPDGNWSDHAGGNPNEIGDGGPSWVAAIVNAIGATPSACEGGNGYWSDTVILVVWDDWGGYYDDVVPPDCATNPCTGYSNLTGQQYVYGFRVPLLVVGAYAKQGYISGANVFPPNCNPPSTYCHDFGSILNFIEYAFGTGGNPLGFPGGISPSYHYADFLAMDYNPNQQGSYSLSDFFDFSTFHSFQTVNGAKYPPQCFHVPHPNNGTCFDGSDYPQDPDNDANESD